MTGENAITEYVTTGENVKTVDNVNATGKNGETEAAGHVEATGGSKDEDEQHSRYTKFD